MTLEECEKITGLHFTIKHTGKMENMLSLSTAPQLNTYCQKRCGVIGSVCNNCFSLRILKRQKNNIAPLEKNYNILTSEVVNTDNLPLLNCLYFRLESFGDLQNEIQVINFFNLCKRNKKTNFALWTKNPEIIKKAIAAGNSKPENLNIIYSSFYINKPSLVNYEFIDGLFTVYDNNYAIENKVTINCGSKKCINCLKCYKKSKDFIYINELKK